MANNLIAAPSPHVQSARSVRSVMRDVLVALLPALIVSTWIFGWRVLALTALSAIACVVFEYLIRRFVVRGSSTVGDLSAVVTGVLLAFNLPVTIPWWIVVVGAFVSIAVAKMTYGGLGKNPFNPALVGRVFLLFAYPVQMTSFGTDAFSGATPLAAMKYTPFFSGADLGALFVGDVAGSMGEVAAAALLLGFAYLLWRKVITWHIPVAIFATMFLFAFCVALGRGWSGTALLEFPLFHLLAGGAMLGAIYMATDYTTSPMTVRGGIVYAVGIGALTMCIRLWGDYPEGMSFAILLMNAVTPLIDKYVRPRRFGTHKHEKIKVLP